MTAPTRQGLTVAQLAAIVALLQAQSTARQKLTTAAVTAAIAPFQSFTDWWDAKAVSKAVQQVLRTLQPLQRQMARQTDVFAARVLTTMSGRSVRPVGAIDVTRLRRKMPKKLIEDLADETVAPAWVDLGGLDDGPSEHIDDPFEELVAAAKREWLDPGDVYGRVADGARYDQVVQGMEEPKARQRALVRISAAAHTDMTLAVRAQYEAALKQGRTVRADAWRRILRPELSQSGPCGLCVVAADRVYSTGDLLPLHDRCVCEVLPIMGDLDPGLLLNDDDLKRLYAAAGEAIGVDRAETGGGKRQGGALKKIRVALTEHGELGPVLTRADHNFRGMQQVAKTQSKDRRHRIEAEIETLEKTFERLIARRRAGENVDRSYEWQSNTIDKLRAELAQLV